MIRADEVPIWVGLLLAAILMWGDRRNVKLHTGWLLSAAVLGLTALALPEVLGQLDGSQYNLKELFRADRSLPHFRLMLLCLWGPLTASWAAELWKNGPRWQALCWAPASCLVGWGILRRSVTVESIQDLLGAPVLSLPVDLEYIARFGALYLPFVWLPLFLVILSTSSRRRFAAGAVFSAGLVLAAPTIIQHYSPSDNVRELFHSHGASWFAGLCLFTIWTAVLCGKSRRVGWWTPAALAVLAAVPAWAMLDRSVRLDHIPGLLLSFPLFAGAFAVTILCLMPALASNRPNLHASSNAFQQ